MASPSRRAAELARAEADAAIAAVRSTYAHRLGELARWATPPLTNAELSRALGLSAPGVGEQGVSAVGRFVSDAPRNRQARPDAGTRALIDALVEGRLALAIHTGPAGRQTLVCTVDEARRLERGWDVVSPQHRHAPASLVADAWDEFGGGVAASFGASRAAQHADGPTTARWLGPWRLEGSAIGAMRLTTSGGDEEAALLTLVAALEAGVRLIDTADVYATDETDLGRNERLIARALARWGGPRHDVIVATKAGLTRPGGRWIPDGSPRRLRASAEASLRHLGVDALDVIQLHVVDPRVPIAESVGELRRLVDEGKARHVGVCNVDLELAIAASREADLVSVQNAAAWPRATWLSDELARWCHERGTACLVHTPLGGPKGITRLRANATLARLAAESDESPVRLALGWLRDLGPGVIPLPGPTRVETARLSGPAAALSPECTKQLDADAAWAPAARATLWAHEALVGDGVALLVGPPGAGKTSDVERFVSRGYARLNRDLEGGSLADLVPKARALLAGGTRRIVLDNTYPTRRSRAGILDAAAERELPTACLRFDTSRDDAARNVVERMLDRTGQLLGGDSLKSAGRSDPNLLPPGALDAFFAAHEPPETAEGFGVVVGRPFARRTRGTARALLLDLDGTLRVTRSGAPYPSSPSDVQVLPRRAEILARYRDDGWLLCGVSNQSGVAAGRLTEADVAACVAATLAQLGVELTVRWCPHAATGSTCWCRKPRPGLAVALARELSLDLSLCTVVGDQESDAALAHGVGASFVHSRDFFDDPV
ncbi:MAG: HAD-IIIA family hydrolase [Myxococcales bacterium]|nr:HAD-IIIA family hydrolase [Myxococcales bacterium]